MMQKKRYLLIKGTSINQEIVESILKDYLGILGYAKANPKFIKKTNDSLILLINHKSLDDIRTAIFLSGKSLKIEKVSGMIRNLIKS